MASTFSTYFDASLTELYRYHGLDCTYTRGTESWTVILTPHLYDPYTTTFSPGIQVSPIKLCFRSLVSSTDAVIGPKCASQTFITPRIDDRITFNGEDYKICPEDADSRGWEFMNDRRSQILIHTMKASRVSAH